MASAGLGRGRHRLIGGLPRDRVLAVYVRVGRSVGAPVTCNSELGGLSPPAAQRYWRLSVESHRLHRALAGGAP
jgi:hypothetical protein